MTSVTVIKPPSRIVAVKRDKDMTLHNTIRDCARQDLEKLSAEFFDAVDDFLFLSGTKGQFADDSSYLRGMREMRAKQSLFEEAFLQLTLATLFPLSKEASKEQLSAPRHLIDRHAAVFEMLEIDLALRSMHRKAQKQYADFSGQIDALVTDNPAVTGGEPNKQFALVNSCLWAFGESQRVFNLPLEIRLVVIKLFEQHFLLHLSPLFQSVIGILKSARSGSAASKPNLTIARFGDKEIGVESPRKSKPEPKAMQQSADFDALVDAVIKEVCQGQKLPTSLINVIESSWRPVMFLIGRNRGCTSHDWLEARTTLQLLVSMSVGQSKEGEADLAKLRKRLREGFELLQMPAAEQQQALDSIEQYLIPLQLVPDSTPSQTNRHATKPPEASISPSGKQILNREDLREICDLLDASGGGELSTPSMEDELLACLPDLDGPGATATIEYKINGKFQLCSLKRSVAKPGMYNINDRQSKITITRSRLGLAISMKAGELRFTGARSPSVVAKTVFETSSRKPKS